MAPETAEIGERCEHPYRRYSKRDDTEQLYGMTGSASRKEMAWLRLLDGIDALRSTDFFDHVAQRRIHKALVQRASAHAGRERHFADFAQKTRTEGESSADHAFGKRQ